MADTAVIVLGLAGTLWWIASVAALLPYTTPGRWLAARLQHRGARKEGVGRVP